MLRNKNERINNKYCKTTNSFPALLRIRKIIKKYATDYSYITINHYTTQVTTIPTGSVNIANDTYLITLLVMCMYLLSAVRLIFSISCMWSERNNSEGMYEIFWLVYECILLTMVLSSLFVLFARWQFMEIAEKILISFAEKRIATIVLNVVLVHEHVNQLASVTFALTVFRLYRSEMNMTSMVNIDFAIHNSVFQMVVIFGYYVIISYISMKTINVYIYLNSLLTGKRSPRNILFLEFMIFLVLNVILIVIIIKVILKRYIISIIYLQKLSVE